MKGIAMSAGVCFCLFAVLTVTYTAPHQRKQFHEHVEDFFGLILAERGLDIELLFKRYGESKEFGMTANYLRTTNFKEVLLQVEALPEFQAVMEYLESAHIDVNRILEHINELVEHNERARIKPKRHKDGELDMSAFMQESINLFPKEKLARLFEEKEKEYPRFRHSMEKLKTKEWEQLYQALLESKGFRDAENTLANNGLDVRLFIEQLKALFGQN